MSTESSDEFKRIDIVPKELKQSDIVPKELKQSDIVPKELKQSDIVLKELKQSDIVPKELKQSDIVPKELKLSDIKVYYINLDRRPDRNEFMSKQLENQTGVKPIRFKAIEGAIHTFTEEETKLFSKADFKGTKHYLGIAGNFLSHLELWKKIIEEEDDYIVILQDDIALVPDFGVRLHKVLSDLPQDSEIINIAQLFLQPKRKNYFVCNLSNQTKMRNKVTFIKKEVTSEVGILHPFINPQSSGYIITKKGAENLIKHTYAQGVLQAVDAHLNKYLISKNIFYQSYYVLGTVASKFGSDIFF